MTKKIGIKNLPGGTTLAYHIKKMPFLYRVGTLAHLNIESYNNKD